MHEVAGLKLAVHVVVESAKSLALIPEMLRAPNEALLPPELVIVTLLVDLPLAATTVGKFSNDGLKTTPDALGI